MAAYKEGEIRIPSGCAIAAPFRSTIEGKGDAYEKHQRIPFSFQKSHPVMYQDGFSHVNFIFIRFRRPREARGKCDRDRDTEIPR